MGHHLILSLKHAHTLSYLSRFFLVANSIDPASSISSCVTGGTGHFSRNSMKTVGKNSFAAVLLIFAARYSVLRDSSHSFWPLVVHGVRVIFISLKQGDRFLNEVPATVYGLWTYNVYINIYILIVCLFFSQAGSNHDHWTERIPR